MAVERFLARAYRLLPVCLFILFGMVAPARGGTGEGEPAYVDGMIATAAARGLAAERQWRVLLHYPDGAAASLVDDPAFFLSPEGKASPAAELTATLRAMFAPAPLDDSHALCRYPARAEWLRRELAPEEGRLPTPSCPELDKYLETVNPHSASLMFPAAYMNSPASMFGHTYLRIDSRYSSDLLGYAVNYAAKTDESNGMVYAWKGVFGLYRGYFSILPHYAKIREYSGMEHRDIWEYRLNLERDELRRMTLHIWELRERYSDYYFFDENCSFNLLFLLETARPSLSLTSRTTPWIIPLDTVTRIKRSGLVATTRFRPSQGDRIRLLVRKLDDGEVDLAMELSRVSGPEPDAALSSRPPERRATILDLAVELLQHDYDKQRIPQEEYRGRLLHLLRERSRLPVARPFGLALRPVEPERGHPSARVTLGGGSDHGRGFLEVGVRPAYHGLDDPAAGYLEGAQIQFLNVAARYYPGRERLRLQRLDLVDIVSLAPYDRIFHRVSWKVNSGFTRILDRSGGDAPVWQLASGGGVARELGDRTLVYLMPDLDLYLGGLKDLYAVGGGVSAGLLVRATDAVTLQVRGRRSWYPLAEFFAMTLVESSLSHALNRANCLEALYGYRSSAGHHRHEATFLWKHYF